MLARLVPRALLLLGRAIRASWARACLELLLLELLLLLLLELLLLLLVPLLVLGRTTCASPLRVMIMRPRGLC